MELLVVMSIIAILLGMSPMFMAAAHKGLERVRGAKDKHDKACAEQIKSEDIPDTSGVVPNAVPASVSVPIPSATLPVGQHPTPAVFVVQSESAPAGLQDPSQIRGLAMRVLQDARADGPIDGTSYDRSVPGSWPQ